MKQLIIKRNYFLLFAVCSLLPVSAIAQPKVWVTPSLSRTGPSDPAGSGSTAQLYAGRGEVESFQVIVQAPAGGLNNVNFSVSNLTGPGGAVIPSSAFTLFREQYVYVNQGSVNWGGSNQPMGAGWYPDGLIPFNDPSTGAPIKGAAIEAVPFTLGATQNAPIWVDLLIPRTATPGAYTGTYTVSSNQGSYTGTISVTVWHFTLPLQSTLKSAMLFWSADSVQGEEELLRNKVSPLRSNTGDQSTLMSDGMSTVGLPYFSGANTSNCSLAAPPTVAQLKAASAAQAPGLSQMVFSVDEILHCSTTLFPSVQQWGYNLHQAGIKNMATLPPTPGLYDDGSGTNHSAVDIWAMLPIIYDQNVSQMSVALNKGDSLWSYNALVQDAYSPKWTIDFSPVNFRIQPGFISQSLNLTGLLYWRIDYWQSDPWNQVNNVGQFSTNNYPGEGALVYPGAQVGIAGVAPSMRLKWIRDGVKDYEYVAMLKNNGQGSWAMGLANSVGANWSNWSQSPTAITGVRMQMGQELDTLFGGSTATSTPSTPAAPAAPVPAAAPGGNVAPAVVTVAPVNNGKAVTFSIIVSDANGANDLAGAGTIVNITGAGANGCWFYYNLDNATVSLANDSGTSWAAVTQGSGSTISNSQCSIAGTGFGAVKSGNTATITVTANFPGAFSGAQSINIIAIDHENLNSGYQNMGKWMVP